MWMMLLSSSCDGPVHAYKSPTQSIGGEDNSLLRYEGSQEDDLSWEAQLGEGYDRSDGEVQAANPGGLSGGATLYEQTLGRFPSDCGQGEDAQHDPVDMEAYGVGVGGSDWNHHESSDEAAPSGGVGNWRNGLTL